MTATRAQAITFSIVLVLAALPFTLASAAQDLEDTGAIGTAGTAIAGVTGPVDEIVAPTSGAPTFLLQGDELRVELASDAEPLYTVSQVTLVPSYGDGPEVLVHVGQGGLEQSQVWEGPYTRDVIPLTGEIPQEAAPGLYDIEVEHVDDEARRAVQIYEAWPEEPRIVLVADTQTGDPRAMEDGFHGSTGIHPLSPHETHPDDLVLPPDPHPFNNATEQTLGIDVLNVELEPGDRWWAYRAAIHRINAMDPAPDMVLFSGDLTFGQLVPGSYHAEYEEAWALLNGGTAADGTTYEGFHVPTLLSPGNHDAYAANGEDGFAFWEAYFGPRAFVTSFSNVTLAAINTYDWSELDRMGITYAVSAWGGQVREEQLTWLRTELCEATGGTVDDDHDAIAEVGCIGGGHGRVVTFSHHSPSWIQDPWEEQYDGAYQQCPCQGTPVLEQVGRGIVTFTTTDQDWSGDGRLELRDTLREFGVDLHAAGHTHQDRVARDIGDGTIVETPQIDREELDVRELHVVQEDGTAQEIGFEEGKQLFHQGTGPLYVETTTTASGTDAYWGYKPVIWHTGPHDMPADALGIPPFEMGYPMTQDLLDQIAGEPDRWNPDHAELGLFSTPTFLPGQGS